MWIGREVRRGLKEAAEGGGIGNKVGIGDGVEKRSRLRQTTPVRGGAIKDYERDC